MVPSSVGSTTPSVRRCSNYSSERPFISSEIFIGLNSPKHLPRYSDTCSTKHACQVIRCYLITQALSVATWQPPDPPRLRLLWQSINQGTSKLKSMSNKFSLVKTKATRREISTDGSRDPKIKEVMERVARSIIRSFRKLNQRGGRIV